jgi:hypothetical protein
VDALCIDLTLYFTKYNANMDALENDFLKLTGLPVEILVTCPMACTVIQHDDVCGESSQALTSNSTSSSMKTRTLLS